MFTLAEILKVTGGRLINGSPAPVAVRGFSINSRTIQPREAFIAIAGKNFDGHSFLQDVIKKSALLLIVSQKDIKVDTAIPVVLVKDTVKALGKLAQFHRNRFSIPVIAITGSAGKTTTKEMLSSVLSSSLHVLKNIATENNHIGVPMTLLRMNASHQAAVIEFGTNCFGDIRYLTEITEPTISVLLNIGESHLEFLKNRQGVFREKFNIVKFMRKNGTVIFNCDDHYLRKILQKNLHHRLVTFGIEQRADFIASSIKVTKNFCVEFVLNQKASFRLNIPAYHYVYNCLAVIACARLFKIPYEDIQKRFDQLEFPKGRQAIYALEKFYVIDDTYNANPVSVRSALKTLESLDTGGRRVFVCADMLELGDQSADLHAAIGKLVGQSNIQAVFTLGNFSKLITEEAQRMNKNLLACHCETLDSVHNSLKAYCQPGDVILVKGSHGMQMERTVNFLTGH